MRWFWGLHSCRTSSMNGPEPITFQEIQAWVNLYNLEIRSYEIDMIKYLDSAYLSHIADQQAKERKKNSKSK